MSESAITKKALASTMKALMAERPFAKISVSDICAACGMHRKSFYYHFRDKYDLVNWTFYHDFVEITVNSQPESFSGLYLRLCEYFYENRVFYRNALSVEGQNSFGEYYRELFGAAVRAYFEEDFSEEDDEELLAQYYGEASLLSLSKWLKTSPCPPPGEYVGLMKKALKSLLKIAKETGDA